MPYLSEPNPAPVVLAFDTSTERLALGLQTAAGPRTLMDEGGARASATLLPQIRDMLSLAGLGFADLDYIAFGRGPGAFTGLRTACAVAQGLGLGCDRPLLPIDSLLIVAEDARLQAGSGHDAFELAVAMDARMDEVYAGRYAWCGGGWQELQAPALYSLAALEAAWREADITAVAGSALAAFGARLVLPAAAVRFEFECDRAAALLRLAGAAAGAGGGVDAAAALPLYVRDKVAYTTAEREAARAAARGAP
jgi:tRNA threonylcarbamoyladenosine biosynthesis protein TsaB